MAIEPIETKLASLRPGVEHLTVSDLIAERVRDPELLVIDIRELQERIYRGAIPGSEHVPRGMLEFWADPSLDYFRPYFAPDRRTVLYCAGGGRSILAAAALMEMGYERVANLVEGFRGWEDAGEPVEDVASTSRWVRRS